MGKRSIAINPGAHQSDGNSQTRRAAQRGDTPALLNGRAHGAGVGSEARHGAIEVFDRERKTPQPGRPISPSRLNDVVRLLNDLENLLAKAKERLARRSGWRRQLADPAQLQASRL